MPKIDWLWLLAGLAVGIVIHKLATHPKSPVANIFGSSMGKYN